MRVSVEKSGPLERKISVTVPNDKIIAATQVKMKEFRKSANLKGFRKGHVPPEYIEKEFGEQIHHEVVNELINSSFSEALDQESLRPCARPDLKTIQAAKGNDIEYEASFEVYPEVELIDFKSLTVDEPTAEITDADIEDMFSKFKDQMSDWSEVEEAAENKHRIKADVTREVEGQVEPTTNNDVTIMLDEEIVLPQIVKGLLKHKAGDEVELNITYPEDWNESAVAGKKATLKVTIKKVEEKQELSDEGLLEKMGDAGKDGIGSVKEKLKEGMESELERAKFEQMKESLMKVLLEKHTFDCPAALLAQEQTSVESELKNSGRTAEEPVEELALKRVKLGLILNEVIRSKEIKPDGLKVQAEIQRIARQFGSSPEIIKAYYSNRELMQSVEHTVLLEEAINAILEETSKTPQSTSYDALINGKTA
ncbi:MAG: trigger factor [Legionellales bacterium]|nr:trigger factor [Legionellales bacterium]|tara:strand:- start:1693 stop:2967 length:1275 start_codon:yes stop_codon:yes gene_type:complete